MATILRGMKNVLRSPVRLILVVLLLGACLMFVASMVSLNASAQQQIDSVQTNIGTAITISYARANIGGNTHSTTTTTKRTRAPPAGGPPGPGGGPTIQHIIV